MPAGAELWIVGRPRMDIAPLLARAPPGVRFISRYVPDAELAAYFRRADVVVLPYSRTERFDQSGVLATALAFAKPVVLSDVGGFGEVAADRRRRCWCAGDPAALAAALPPAGRRGRARAAGARGRRAAAAGPYSWDEAARRDARRLPRADGCAGRRCGTIGAAVTALAIVFWISVGLLLYAHAGYLLLLGR